MKRVYHPTLNSWQDVPDSCVEDWSDMGWRKTKPAHVDTSGAPPVGEVEAPVEVAPTVVEATPKKTATK